MNLYEITALENQIEIIAEQNDGEIPEELFQELVEKQTESLVQIENLCKYIRHLELGIDMCKSEIDRINKMKEKANKRIEGIKKYLTPYIAKQGKIEAGTFILSIRKSESVNIINEQKIPLKYFDTIPESLQVNKKIIKEAIKSGKDISGAELEKKNNLQIK